MNKMKVASLAATGSVLAMAGGLITASPASASFTALSTNLTFSVEGSGTFVSRMTVSVGGRASQHFDAPIHGFFEITGPKQKYTSDTKEWGVGFPEFFHTFNTDVPAGEYCATLWSDEPDRDMVNFHVYDRACGPVG
jgi:hypothetical protein